VVKAEKALEYGLINEVVPRDELNDRVESIARLVSQAPLTTLMATKANIKRAWELMGMRVHWQTSNDLVVLASMSKDVQALIGQVLSGQIKPAEMAQRQAAAAAATDGSAAS
jgi:enoyl-CoA hydratase